MNPAEELIKSLGDHGVKYIFGIEGGSWIPYLEEMRKSGIEFILVANEASAGIMADVCYRITGVPGVCYATYGPGATNLSTGVGCAWLDRSAVIALTSEFGDKKPGKRVQMYIDHQSIFKDITKWTTRLKRGEITNTANRAFEVSMEEVPGPVHLGIPSDIDTGHGGVFPAESSSEQNDTPPPDRALLKLLDKTLENSKKPLITAGLTASRLKLGKKLNKLIDRFNIPVALTPMAKGLISQEHKCYSGVLFHASSEKVSATYNEADLIIAIGYDPVEFNFEDWMPDVPLINIDTVYADVDSRIKLVCDIRGNVGDVLDHLYSLPLLRTEWDFEDLEKKRKSIFKTLSSPDGVFGPRTILRILRRMMPDDGILTCDVGAHTHLIGQMWSVENPGMLLMTNGWSSMGFGIPSAIAAKILLRQRQVACVTGDGGFLMMAGEIITARRLGLNIVFIVLADNELSLIKVKQDREGVINYGIRLYEGDLLNEKSFFGVPVETVRSEENFESALKRGFNNSGPVIIEAVIDSSEYSKLITGKYK